jgi:hypothetical protein
MIIFVWSSKETMPNKDMNKLASGEVFSLDTALSEKRTPPPHESELNSHLKDLTWRDGAEILADAANLIPIPGVGSAIKLIFALDKYSPEERIKDKQFKWVLEQISKISNNLDDLLAKLPREEQPEPSDVAAIIEAAMETSRKTAGAKKRKLLKNAVVNAFSFEHYQSGLTLRFFSILQDLEYGDVELLHRIQVKPSQLSSLNDDFSALTYHHLELLNKMGLVMIWNHSSNTPLGMSGGNLRISELGKKLLEFVAEPDVA